MNILKFEIKSLLKSFLVWNIAIISVFYSLVIGVYPMFSDSLDILNDMMANMPVEFIQAFGFDFNTMLSYGGFYDFSFTYISIMGAIMSASMAIYVFSKEKKSKSLEFIFSKPIDRKNIFLYKLLAVFIVVTVSGILYTIFCVYYFVKYDTELSTAILSSITLLLTEYVFVAFGVLIAVYKKKIRSASEIASCLGFAGFIMSAIVNILEKDFLKFISPLQFFTPRMITQNGCFDISLVAWSLFIIASCIGFAYTRYIKNDISNI